MNFAADLLLAFGALAAAFYCFILSKRLKKLKGLDQDLGGAIAVLSQQVDEMTKVLSEAQETANTTSQELDSKTKSAVEIADRIDLLMGALHDLPDVPAPSNTVEKPKVEVVQKDVTVFMRARPRRRVFG